MELQSQVYVLHSSVVGYCLVVSQCKLLKSTGLSEQGSSEVLRMDPVGICQYLCVCVRYKDESGCFLTYLFANQPYPIVACR